MNIVLRVFREVDGFYQYIGVLGKSRAQTEEEIVFSYTPEYLANADAESISLVFPLQSESFSAQQTRSFFEGLLPEGEMLRLLAQSFHTGTADFLQLLSHLNNESAGALVFGFEEDALYQHRHYMNFGFDSLQEFAYQPRRVSLNAGMASRLSLAGVQTKLGLYHDGNDPLSGWFLPEGSAPSTHIIKASDETFPLQTLNEAFCLEIARNCGFDVSHSFLIPIANSDPLLAIERFDRIIPESASLVDGCKVPHRLHQEDFCQAAGLPPNLKYEPTDGHYLSLATRIIDRSTSEPFATRVTFFSRILFDFLIGNCDYHLKNHSLLWNKKWSERQLSPLYDITCTTFYPDLAREMGISLCQSRRIDDVVAEDIRKASLDVGLPEKIGWGLYLELREQLPDAINVAEKELMEQGFPEVSGLAEFIRSDIKARHNL